MTHRHTARTLRTGASARRALTLALPVALICVLLSSCSSAEPEPDPAALDVAGIDLDQYQDVTAQLDFETGTAVLPLNAIRRNTPELQELRAEATHTVINACLEDSGLPPYTDWSPTPSIEEDRLYGVWSTSLAARYGYESPSTVEPSEPPVLTSEQQPCFDSARSELSDLLSSLDSLDLDTQIYFSSYAAVQASEEGKAAIALAQKCMTDAGLSIDPESGQPRTDQSPGNSETNVRIALTNAKCNVETGAIQTLFDLTAKYQAALIDRNEAAAVALAEKKAKLMAAFTAVIEGKA